MFRLMNLNIFCTDTLEGLLKTPLILNPAELEDLSFVDLIREACDRGLLLSDLVAWKRYRQERGTTSHTYEQEKACEIFEEIPEFLKEAKYLLEQLELRK